jgi:hypothetical protein
VKITEYFSLPESSNGKCWEKVGTGEGENTTKNSSQNSKTNVDGQSTIVVL